MKAVYFNQTLSCQPDTPTPKPTPNEALIRTRLAGICNTDLEILRGYTPFTGILGHEFVGEVVQSPGDPALVGKRVVGEINTFCGQCANCKKGNTTHCQNRTTLGIHGKNGVMAEYFTLPSQLLYPLPLAIPDECAVFVEPLAAACEITDRVHIRPPDRVIVLGDGKLGLLVAQVLQLTGCDLLVVGHHPENLMVLERRGIHTQLADDPISPGADIVIEATGNPDGFHTARKLVRPRGTLVLKSTYHGQTTVNLSQLVVDEITLIGSRCGPFPAAIHLLEQRLVDVRALIHAIFPLDKGLDAFERATHPGVLKVLLSNKS